MRTAGRVAALACELSRPYFIQLAIVFAAYLAIPPASTELTLPNRAGSVKFAAMGDNGTGKPPQYETAEQMAAWHTRFPFEFVLMLGDHIYGSQKPADFVQKFERPYKTLLDAGVLCYGCLRNHDR